MISALAWVRKGAALLQPERLELSDEEFARIQKELGVQLEDAQLDLEEEKLRVGDVTSEDTKVEKIDDDLAIYNLDTYDDDEEKAEQDDENENDNDESNPKGKL